MIALKEILQSLNYTFLLLSAATPTYYGDITKALDVFDMARVPKPFRLGSGGSVNGATLWVWFIVGDTINPTNTAETLKLIWQHTIPYSTNTYCNPPIQSYSYTQSRCCIFNI